MDGLSCHPPAAVVGLFDSSVSEVCVLHMSPRVATFTRCSLWPTLRAPFVFEPEMVLRQDT